MDASSALTFIRDRGIVLASARGPVPSLAEQIAGAPIRGSWWAHPRSHAIFAVLQALAESRDILSCRLVNGHVTFVHRRLWPALVKLDCHFDRDRLAWVGQEHTPSGRHVGHSIAYPTWVPPDVLAAARLLDEQEAKRLLGPVADLPRTVSTTRRYPASGAGRTKRR